MLYNAINFVKLEQLSILDLDMGIRFLALLHAFVYYFPTSVFRNLFDTKE